MSLYRPSVCMPEHSAKYIFYQFYCMSHAWMKRSNLYPVLEEFSSYPPIADPGVVFYLCINLDRISEKQPETCPTWSPPISKRPSLCWFTKCRLFSSAETWFSFGKHKLTNVTFCSNRSPLTIRRWPWSSVIIFNSFQGTSLDIGIDTPFYLEVWEALW